MVALNGPKYKEYMGIFKIPGLNKVADYSEGISMAKFDSESNHVIIMNHLDIIIEIHGGTNADRYKIVGFEVYPKSIDWGSHPCAKFSNPNKIPPMIYKDRDDPERDPIVTINFTYSVKIKKSELLWTHRFDHYVRTGRDKVHHLQILLAVIIAGISASLVWFCMNRVIVKDLATVRRNNDKLKKARD